MIDLILAPIWVWFSWVVVGFLGKNYPKFTLWVLLPLCGVVGLLVFLAQVAGCYLAIWGPADAVETIDCSAPFIQCINADGDSR